jgi:isochorismate hydrolase
MSDHDKILEIIRLKDQVSLALDPRKTALLVIDMQRYFLDWN